MPTMMQVTSQSKRCTAVESADDIDLGPHKFLRMRQTHKRRRMHQSSLSAVSQVQPALRDACMRE